jgi:large subunit ribosomal protein L24
MVKSSQPGKQRIVVYQADSRLLGRLMGAHLSKELKKKYNQPTVPVRVGDNVKIMRGDHKGKTGKILEVDRKRNKVFIQGFSHKKTDGKEAFVSFRPSNLLVTGVESKDKLRFKKAKVSTATETKTPAKTKEPVKETKVEEKKEAKPEPKAEGSEE